MTALRLSSVSKLSRLFASGSLFRGCQRLKSTNPGILRRPGNDNGIESRLQPGKLPQTPQPYDSRMLRPEPVSLSNNDELYLGPNKVKKLRIIRYPFSRGRRGEVPPVPGHILNKTDKPFTETPLPQRKESHRTGDSGTVPAALANVLDLYEEMSDTGKRRTGISVLESWSAQRFH